MLHLLGGMFDHLTQCVLKVVQWAVFDNSIEANKPIDFDYLKKPSPELANLVRLSTAPLVKQLFDVIQYYIQAGD
jgi:hypothetical protein